MNRSSAGARIQKLTREARVKWQALNMQRKLVRGMPRDRDRETGVTGTFEELLNAAGLDLANEAWASRARGLGSLQ